MKQTLFDGETASAVRQARSVLFIYDPYDADITTQKVDKTLAGSSRNGYLCQQLITQHL